MSMLGRRIGFRPRGHLLHTNLPLSAGVLWRGWWAVILKDPIFNALSAHGTVLHLQCTSHTNFPKNNDKGGRKCHGQTAA